MQDATQEKFGRTLSLEDSEAKWIWPARFRDLVNQYVDFRHDFSLDQVDPQTELLVSADSNYAVWINGIFVDCGQYHDYPNRKTYDRLAFAEHLRVGSNTLMVTAYYQGADSFQYLQGDPGVIFLLRGGGRTVASGTNTRYRQTPGYRQGPVSRVTRQLGFTFEYDARDEGADWSDVESDDVVGSVRARGLTPRPLEKLLMKPRQQTVVCAQGLLRRENRADQDQQSAAWIMQRDLLSTRFPQELFRSPVPPLVLPSEGGIEFAADVFCGEDGAYLVIDLGREEAGLLEIDVETDAGTSIDIAHGEHLDDLRVRATVGRRNFANRYVCRHGRQVFTHFFSRLAGRYLQLHVLGVKTKFRLHYAGLRPTEYPLEIRGDFGCADTLTGMIYRTGLRTLHLCMHEHYEDCPWREQALYAFDARNQALCGYYGFGEYRFPAASFGLLADSLKEDGYLEMCAPAKIDITIPMFSLAWVLAVDDYWLYSAEQSFVFRMLPFVQRMLGTHIARMEQGLLPCPLGERYWQFYEWAPGLDGSNKLVSSGIRRFDAPLNLMFCLALDAGARLSRVCGDQSGATEFQAVADRLRRRIGEAFWDGAEGAYLTYLGDEAPRHFSEFVQSLALLAGVPGTADAGGLRQRLSLSDNGFVVTTLSHCHYKFEALMMEQQVYGQEVFRRIGCDWGHMLLRGATSFWETIRGGDDFNCAGSLCHGWSAVPVYFYSAYLLGVRPLEAGFRRFTVDPVVGVTQAASGIVPTPYGEIRIEWVHRDGLIECRNIQIPDQTELVLGGKHVVWKI